jgi:hypothetical protein
VPESLKVNVKTNVVAHGACRDNLFELRIDAKYEESTKSEERETSNTYRLSHILSTLRLGNLFQRRGVESEMLRSIRRQDVQVLDPSRRLQSAIAI